jgi:hypothetical protein
LGETLPDVNQDPEFAAFVASPQYPAWVEKRRTEKNKSPDQAANGDQENSTHDDIVVDDTPIAGPTTRVSKPISSIKSLEVYTTDSGMMLGQTSEVTLTVARGDKSKLTGISFATAVGDEMLMSCDEAVRFIRVSNPNWYADKAELSFEDKYVGHDGGSIGAAVGTLILSSIQGFEIDPDSAITGDISANGKIRAIGGVLAKIRGATAAKCKVIAIPVENFDQLVDAMVYGGTETVVDVQVIGIQNLDDAVAVMRKDRDHKLAEAIANFDGVRDAMNKSPEYIHSVTARQKLEQILQLVPQHLSAKLLLLVAHDQAPKTLSATASLYYTSVAVRTMMPILDERDKLTAPTKPSNAVIEGIAELKKLQPLADESVRPLIDAWSKFISDWSRFQAADAKKFGDGSKEVLETEAQSVSDAMAKLKMDEKIMQKMLKEGI